jgi:hypothetical protein
MPSVDDIGKGVVIFSVWRRCSVEGLSVTDVHFTPAQCGTKSQGDAPVGIRRRVSGDVNRDLWRDLRETRLWTSV